LPSKFKALSSNPSTAGKKKNYTEIFLNEEITETRILEHLEEKNEQQEE
jgi:hypothetical protein